MPDVLADPGTGSVLQLLIVMVCSQNYIRNPYLLAKLVEVVFVMQPMVQPRAHKINQALLMHELALSFLAPALMQFYVGQCPSLLFSTSPLSVIVLPQCPPSCSSMSVSVLHCYFPPLLCQSLSFLAPTLMQFSVGQCPSLLFSTSPLSVIVLPGPHPHAVLCRSVSFTAIFHLSSVSHCPSWPPPSCSSLSVSVLHCYFPPLLCQSLSFLAPALMQFSVGQCPSLLFSTSPLSVIVLPGPHPRAVLCRSVSFTAIFHLSSVSHCPSWPPPSCSSLSVSVLHCFFPPLLCQSLSFLSAHPHAVLCRSVSLLTPVLMQFYLSLVPVLWFYLSSSSSSAFDMMVALTRFFLP